MLTQMLFALYAEIKKKISIFIPEEREFTVQSKNTEHNWKSKVNYQIDGSLSHSCYHPTIKKIKPTDSQKIISPLYFTTTRKIRFS